MTESRPRSFFLLSPASTAGRRAAMLLSPRAGFGLALRIRSPAGAPIGEVFAFLSGLYFRGKLAYARRFAADARHIRIITSDRGLVEPDAAITLADLRAMARSRIDPTNAKYRTPLARDAEVLAQSMGSVRAVLLGSIATGKYADVLGQVFAERLEFPVDFVGRGDMSRGGLMLRSAESGVELPYVPVSGSIRKGVRPPRLPPRQPVASSQ